eukprot:GDKK01046603.1.p1 GENE.GDKK01046603.1~~GDKK01046603.1.p1  ORF type:complete len:172 (-),score=30.61 GDKK01046603.1:118-633(-)
MFTMLSVEVNFLIYPAFVIFLLMLIPIPFLSKLVAKLVAKIESIRVGGLSILLVITLVGIVFFLISFNDQREYMFTHPNAVLPEGRHHMDYLSKKWRGERNMYIHAILAVLYSSLLKMARVTLESHELEKKAIAGSQPNSPVVAKTAKVSAPKAAEKTAAPVPPTTTKKMD